VSSDMNASRKPMACCDATYEVRAVYDEFMTNRQTESGQQLLYNIRSYWGSWDWLMRFTVSPRLV